MNLQNKLNEYGLILPDAPEPVGNYVAINIRQNTAFVAIQFPKLNGKALYKGRLGLDLKTEDGYNAMQLCALNVIAHANKKIGIDNIIGLNHVDAYFQASNEWDESPSVTDGASNLFVNLLGEKGIHSRAIFGVDRLPKNFCVGITCSFTITQ